MSSARFQLRNQTTAGPWSPFSDGDFDANPGDVIEAKLEDTPAADIWQTVFSEIDRSEGRAALSFNPSDGTLAAPDEAPTDIVEITLPSERGTWELQCQTNGGVAVFDAGGRPDETVNTKTRMLVVRTENLSLRHPLADDLAKDPDNAAVALQEMLDGVDAIGTDIADLETQIADLTSPGIFDFVAAGAGVSARANNTISTGIQVFWNGEGTAPIVDGFEVRINANATSVQYQVSLLLYTASTTATLLETVNVTTTAIGELVYSASFVSTYTMLARRIYGLRIYAAGETYYTQGTYGFGTTTGPGHLATMKQAGPLVARGPGGAAVFTDDHVTVNNGGSPSAVPQNPVGSGTFHPAKLTFSNAS